MLLITFVILLAQIATAQSSANTACIMLDAMAGCEFQQKIEILLDTVNNINNISSNNSSLSSLLAGLMIGFLVGFLLAVYLGRLRVPLSSEKLSQLPTTPTTITVLPQENASFGAYRNCFEKPSCWERTMDIVCGNLSTPITEALVEKAYYLRWRSPLVAMVKESLLLCEYRSPQPTLTLVPSVLLPRVASHSIGLGEGTTPPTRVASHSIGLGEGITPPPP
eukprot:TRINITY_DN1320_c0_g1_i12.p2 TRINITY_DN1320_c0_g1~~TRINITY_DN1320_c0_g1_i12.p2  ORF type:complete len:222 (-),score=36.58 TRINITY_DN1320_c0_g1_i12:1400-2065(-)